MTVRVTVSTLPPPTVLTHDSEGDRVHHRLTQGVVRAVTLVDDVVLFVR